MLDELMNPETGHLHNLQVDQQKVQESFTSLKTLADNLNDRLALQHTQHLNQGAGGQHMSKGGGSEQLRRGEGSKKKNPPKKKGQLVIFDLPPPPPRDKSKRIAESRNQPSARPPRDTTNIQKRCRGDLIPHRNEDDDENEEEDEDDAPLRRENKRIRSTSGTPTSSQQPIAAQPINAQTPSGRQMILEEVGSSGSKKTSKSRQARTERRLAERAAKLSALREASSQIPWGKSSNDQTMQNVIHQKNGFWVLKLENLLVNQQLPETIFDQMLIFREE